MILIYYPATGILKVKAGRGKGKSGKVAECFATEILGEDPQHFRVCDVVTFAPLLDPEFSFDPEPGDHFKSARPTRVRFRRHAHPEATYDVHYKDDRPGGKSVLDHLLEVGITLPEIAIESMTICFMFKRHNRDSKTVTIGSPDKCTPADGPVDRYVQRVLVRLGLFKPNAKESR